MIALHHVQVSCPRGGEDDARRFYAETLHLTEVEKPPALRARGGAWFRAYDALGAVSAELHVGVEEPFVAARRAHPALVVESLEQVAADLRGAGYEVDLSEHETFPGHLRLHTRDGVGNRVELLQRSPES
ncbi:MAG: glyoxalase [Nocardioides sp.]